MNKHRYPFRMSRYKIFNEVTKILIDMADMNNYLIETNCLYTREQSNLDGACYFALAFKIHTKIHYRRQSDIIEEIEISMPGHYKRHCKIPARPENEN